MTQLLVRDLMSSPVMTVDPTEPLSTVVRLMEEHHLRHIPVIEENSRLVGLISHRDVLRAQEGTLSQEPTRSQMQMDRWIEARWLMTTDVRTVHPETPALEAAHVLRARGYGCVPVVEGGRLVGMVTEADFVELAVRTLSDPGAE